MCQTNNQLFKGVNIMVSRLNIQFLLVMVLFLLYTSGLSAIIKLQDGTEAKVQVIRLTENDVTILAEGFTESVTLDKSEVEYILLDEKRSELIKENGIVLYNKTKLFPDKFKIDTSAAILVLGKSIVNCTISEIAFISYKNLQPSAEILPKTKLTLTDTWSRGEIRVRLINGLDLFFNTFEYQSGAYVFSDGRIRATLYPEIVYEVVFPEDYVKNYPSLIILTDGSRSFFKFLYANEGVVTIETALNEKVNIKLSDIRVMDMNKYENLVRSKNSIFFLKPNTSVTIRALDLGLPYADFVIQLDQRNQISMSSTIFPYGIANKLIIRASGSTYFSLTWRFASSGSIHTTPAVAKDGTIYFGSDDRNLYALNPDGTLKWKFQTGDIIRCSPTIGPDGTIYFGSHDDQLYALNPNGTLKWRFKTGSDIWSVPSIGRDGTIYFGSIDYFFYAVNPDGTLKWRIQTGSGIGSSPAISSDGTIYFSSHDGFLYAVNPIDGSVKWKFNIGGSAHPSPAIGLDGTIYVVNYYGTLYAITPSGMLKWKYQLNGAVEGSIALGPDGTIYLGCFDRNLYAINPDGTLKWRYTTNHEIRCTPAIAADGTIFVASRDGGLHAVASDGRRLWVYGFGGEILWASPVITPGGTVLIGHSNGSLYAVQTISAGPSTSTPWGKFKSNLMNTGLFGEK